MAKRFIVEQNTAEQVLEEIFTQIQYTKVEECHTLESGEGATLAAIKIKELTLYFSPYDYEVLSRISKEATNADARIAASVLRNMLARPTLQMEVDEDQKGATHGRDRL